MASVLLDTGPLVALFKRNDTHHARAVAWFKGHRGPLLTTQAVITEAWHLLLEPARLPLVRFVTAACEVNDFGTQGQVRIAATLERYSDLPMDYADATLVVLAEEIGTDLVFTTDRRDFRVYRIRGRKSFRIVPE